MTDEAIPRHTNACAEYFLRRILIELVDINHQIRRLLTSGEAAESLGIPSPCPRDSAAQPQADGWSTDYMETAK
jgi:hypothetical protein